MPKPALPRFLRPGASRPGRSVRRGRAGFTLMELMAVVGIIVVMASIVVGGFSGIQRAMGASSGASGFRRALAAARQQACVDGTDVYVWCIDIDKYVVCRKGGTISEATETMNKSGANRKLPYMRKAVSDAYWVCDDYADFGSTIKSTYIDSSTIGGTDSDSDDVTSELLEKYKETYIFDLTDKKMARYYYPADYYNSQDYEGWMFGLEKSERSSTGGFTKGHEYAWAVMPVQSLPGGYVFDGSFNQSTGEFLDTWGKSAWVRFFPDGRAETGMKNKGFTITEIGVSNPYSQTVTVSGDGLVSVK
ncbi:MAG: prepilin-type N-terminal cleavage/methylation domain-containing protein [Kiritimatiellae bacterium]|nr:prepilin-type N-terminal cleavage/methylation domain-containing protein [Kiritimatiellia bacterium]